MGGGGAGIKCVGGGGAGIECMGGGGAGPAKWHPVVAAFVFGAGQESESEQ